MTILNLYTTTIKAICPNDGKIKVYCGPYVPGITFKDAENYCNNNGLGYCKVEGLLISEIPVKEGMPDFKNRIDYNYNLN